METKRKSSLKNGSIAILGAATLALGAFSHSQFSENDRLKDQVLELGVKLDYNALEAEYANETFDIIEANLAAIREREGYLVKNLHWEEFDGPSNPEDRIQNEIETIETLIADNNSLIRSLNGQITERDGRLEDYRKSLASSEKRISDYRSKTEKLMAQTALLQTDLSSAKSENQLIAKELVQKEFEVASQSEQLDRKERQLRTAYYAVGTFNELKESEVVQREGGILGIASTKAVKDDLNRDRFAKIDIYDNTTIPVFSKGAELVSNHSTDSYELVVGEDGEVRWIQILDPEKFWENTKYLVVVTKAGRYKETAWAN